jgi:hypothetical protein
MEIFVEQLVEGMSGTGTEERRGNLPQWHPVQRRSHMTRPGIEPTQPRKGARTNHLTYSTVFNPYCTGDFHEYKKEHSNCNIGELNLASNFTVIVRTKLLPSLLPPQSGQASSVAREKGRTFNSLADTYTRSFFMGHRPEALRGS